MKICLVHNTYGKFSGEEAVVNSQVELLTKNGHEVITFTRDSGEIKSMFLGRVRAFWSGIYNAFSVKSFERLLKNQTPDILHIHNLFPLISPAVLHASKDFKVPVVMTVHNYRLICPNGLFMVNGEICEKCCGGREYWCVLKNCEKDFLKSFGYAARNFIARSRKSYLNNIHSFAVLTEFHRNKHLAEGYPDSKIVVIPNCCSIVAKQEGKTPDNHETYIGYAGRISKEKGVGTLLKAAHNLPEVPFEVAGSGEQSQGIQEMAPVNVRFHGHLEHGCVDEFIRNSKIIILCSIWYEGFPMILLEAMLLGRPIIASRIGGIPEIVEDGATGLLFEPGNSEDLTQKINTLWGNHHLCQQMGEAGRQKALREYSPELYYQRLLRLYEKAIDICENEE